MKPRTQAITKEFERRLREARREVWRTVVGTNEELATLEQQARASSEEAGTMAVTGVLSRLDGAERRLLDEIDAAQARLAAGTFGVCARCGKSIPLARLRAVPSARLCVACERDAERARPASGHRPVPHATIVKQRDGDRFPANLDDYARVRASFTWAAARGQLEGLPDGRGLNIAHEAVDRHAAGSRRDRVALRWLGKTGAVRDYTYGHLRELTDRFANALEGLGVRRGDRVFALAGRVPELYVAALGTLKLGTVFCPLFSAFGPEPIRSRMAIGAARVLVTTETLYHRKVAPLRHELPDLAHVILVGEAGARTRVPETHDLYALLAGAADRYVIGPTAPEDMALLHFTSGTTGTPKGAVHVHDAVVAHHITGRSRSTSISTTSSGARPIRVG